MLHQRNHLKHALFSQFQTEDSKEQVAICLQRDALDRITGSDWSNRHQSPTTNSTYHNAELQDVTFAAYFTAPGTHRQLGKLPQYLLPRYTIVTFKWMFTCDIPVLTWNITLI